MTVVRATLAGAELHRPSGSRDVIGRARPWRVLGMWVAVVAVGISSLLVSVAAAEPAVAATTTYVAPWGSDAGPGTAERPYRTIRHAVDSATSGDSVVLRGGVYSESIEVLDKTVHLRSPVGERAVLDGSSVVAGWVGSDGAWFAGDWSTQFRREPSGGPVDQDRIVAGYPDQMFIDGVPLQQVLERSAVVAGTFFHETDTDRIWIGDDPTGREVRASDLNGAIYFNRAHGSSLTNVTVRRYATEAGNMAAIRAYADDIVIDDVLVEQNSRMGLSAIGRDINVRDSSFLDNGYLGVHGERVDGLVVERSAVIGNNASGYDDLHSAAGIKLTNSREVTIRDNDVSFNDGPGIWLDLDTDFVTVVRNLVEGNARAGVEIELSSSVQVLDNVTIDNGEAGIWVLESKNVDVVHNASLRNQNAVEIEEGPRRDVVNVRVFNNILGDASEGSRALLDVNDWTQERDAHQMGVTADHNAYWIPPGSATPSISRWGYLDDGRAYSNDLEAHRATTGLGANSLMDTGETNPYVRSEADLDYRGPDWLPRGATVRPSAADALGIDRGTRIRIGPTGFLTARR